MAEKCHLIFDNDHKHPPPSLFTKHLRVVDKLQESAKKVVFQFLKKKNCNSLQFVLFSTTFLISKCNFPFLKVNESKEIYKNTKQKLSQK